MSSLTRPTPSAPASRPETTTPPGVQDTATVARPRRTAGRLVRGLAQVSLLVGMAVGLNLGYHGATSVAHQIASRDATLSADKNLTPQQHSLASAELEAFGSPTLHWLGDRGVRIQIVEEDVESARILEQNGYLRTTDRMQLAQEAIDLRVKMDQALVSPELKARLSRIDSIQAEQAEVMKKWRQENGLPETVVGCGVFGGVGMMGAGAQLPPRMSELGKSLLAALQAREEVLKQAAGTWGAGVAFPGSMEFSLDLAGAKTDAQKSEYRALMELANGDRLEQARGAALAQAEATLATIPEGPAREAAQKWVATMRSQPDKIFLDRARFGIVEPPVVYVGDKLVPRDGLESIHALGFYMPVSGGIEVDANQLGTTHTLSHEIGHAIEDQLSKEDPHWYETEFKPRLQAAYDAAKARPGTPASQYGLKNTGEYIAEGVKLHFESPDFLAKTDPELAELTRVMLQRADQKGGQGFLGSLALLGGLGMFAASAFLLRRS